MERAAGNPVRAGEAAQHVSLARGGQVPADADVSAVLLPVFRRRKADKWVNVAVDVDPDDLL